MHTLNKIPLKKSRKLKEPTLNKSHNSDVILSPKSKKECNIAALIRIGFWVFGALYKDPPPKKKIVLVII